MKIESNHKLPLVTREDLNMAMICFDEVEKPVERDNIDIIYVYEMVRVSFPYDYSSIVSAIINDHYSNDKMQAIINNHLLETDDEHEKEFQEMQAWRAHAKEIGHLICD